MDRLLIEGGVRLRGHVAVSGSKNAALPILAATILCDGECRIRNVPDLRDVNTMMEVLRTLGVAAERNADGSISTRVLDESPIEAPYKLVSTMRGSISVMGPLLAKRHRARVSLPGGCNFGVRPIDLHVKGLKALGARIEVEHGYLVAQAGELRGTEIYLGGAFGSTVLGTANVLCGAVLARGTTVIENSACEPEVEDLANFLVAAGAKIRGFGTCKLVVEGVERLNGIEYSIIPDRIEAGTFLLAGAITGGEVTVDGARMDHLFAVVDKMRECGVEVTSMPGGARARLNGRPRPTEVTTLPYPGVPTDLQAQLMALLSIADGISIVTEKIYPDRFIHVAELDRLGARIRKEGPNAIIEGVPALSGAEVMASDLRASAALVLAGLVAHGETIVNRVYHIDRGYERLEEKLQKLGARIHRDKA
ncbi:MAG: UDP-N-acetylglucosamine 1-carboxyvinyltransferase [Planctomycetes bacterium]|nr:UDP-N-acetylglucosamine 1-carboxyvinyltransferase [Planctomycetota bacterium]MBI3844322.1 UDP-N-acetylglucosamine 1-carboxyvinyltransferase [Planctomycetota bacterium]